MCNNIYRNLWNQITTILDNEYYPIHHNCWRDRIISLGQVQAVNERENGRIWTNNENFRAALLAILSSERDWSLIENILNTDLHIEFEELFRNFDIQYFCNISNAENVNQFNYQDQMQIIYQLFIQWFNAHNITGKIWLQLSYLQIASRQMQFWINEDPNNRDIALYNKFETFYTENPRNIIEEINRPASNNKLSGFRVPLAAEFLKNIGYDVAKPDRHVNRAVVMWGLWQDDVEWKEGSDDFRSPKFNDNDLINVIQIIENMALAVNEKSCFVDNAIWLLCAKSGLHKTNPQLREMIE